MTRRYLVVFLTVCLLAGLSYGEAQRTVFSHENKLPERHQLEAGLKATFVQYPREDYSTVIERDELAGAPYLRFAVFENMVLNAEIPYVSISPKYGDSEQGFGDATVGAEFLPWQDIFGYPYILPHVSVALPTGDEDKNMGMGETRTQFGVSVGTTVEDVYHFVADVSYLMYRDRGNEISISGAVIWDLSDQFSLHLETLVINDREVGPESNNPIYIIGGMSFRATEQLQFSAYGGSARQAEEDVIAGGKVSYSF
ncbi:MAG: hypothetical protein BWY59_01564 [Verrucomicrobia bacterium ADurb.Bin345]|nr:MAG: hypothetical protein BWY59_01564 [Verrucomicrobia bacterium ADurb.Bin345]